MAGRKKTSGLSVYNLLLKELSQINKTLPEHRKLGLKERRELISKKIYPQYKGIPRSRVRLWPLRELLYRKLKRMPKRQGCDVFALSPEEYTAIQYYALDDQITNIFPTCIYIKVNANGFGVTKIINTRDYNYYSSGLQEITRLLNEEMQKLPPGRRNSSVAPIYTGVIQPKPGKEKSQSPDDYYLEMILYINNKAVEKKEPAKVPSGKSTNKKISEKRRKEKAYIKQKIAEVRFKENKIRAIMSGFLKNVNEYKKSKKKKGFVQEDYAEKQLKKETARLKRYLKEKKVTKNYYDKIKKIIDKGYGVN